MDVGLDPFLYMSHTKMKLPGGFPDHPHRGIETLSYIWDGEVSHEDSTGK
jgi:redox-sensitive bicupin YhaK (pirin superfamily)